MLNYGILQQEVVHCAIKTGHFNLLLTRREEEEEGLDKKLKKNTRWHKIIKNRSPMTQEKKKSNSKKESVPYTMPSVCNIRVAGALDREEMSEIYQTSRPLTPSEVESLQKDIRESSRKIRKYLKDLK